MHYCKLCFIFVISLTTKHKTMATTLIFKSYTDFLNREDKSINGVSETFAKGNANWDIQNINNVGCWNCATSTGCSFSRGLVDCTDCTDCVDCSGCIECASSNDCIDCLECNGCNDCTNAKYLSMQVDCHL